MVNKIKKNFQKYIDTLKRYFFGEASLVLVDVKNENRGSFLSKFFNLNLEKKGAKIAKRFLLLSPVFFTIFFFVFGFSNIQKAYAATITISGQTFSSGLTIKMAVGTSTPSIHSTTSNSNLGGSYTFELDNTYLSSTTPIVLWVDGYSSKVTSLIYGYHNSDAANINLFTNNSVFLTSNFSGGTFGKLDDFGFIDSSYDSDILYTVNSTSTIVHGNITFGASAGGKFLAPTSTLVIEGNLLSVSDSFRANSGTVEMTGGALMSAVGFVGAGAFHNLVISGVVDSASLFNASTTNLTVTPSGNLKVKYNLSVLNDVENKGEIHASSSINIKGTLNNEGVFKTDAVLSVGNSLHNTGTLITKNDLKISRDFNQNGIFNQTAGETVLSEYLREYITGRDSSGLQGSGTGEIRALAEFEGYLFVGKSGNAGTCNIATNVVGCELLVYDISSSTNPVLVNGLDSDGLSGGSGAVGINALLAYSKKIYKYLVIGKEGSASTCAGDTTVEPSSQTRGCEIMIFDISNLPDVKFLKAKDSSFAFNGTSGVGVNSLSYHINEIVALKTNNNTSCGVSYNGCELLTFAFNDKNFTFVSSFTRMADSDGNGWMGSGTGNVGFNAVALKQEVFNVMHYVGKAGNSTACSQVVGAMDGCELLVFPYVLSSFQDAVVGFNGDGTKDGTGSYSINSVVVEGDYLYVGKAGDATPCYGDEAGVRAAGCEVLVFDISSSTDPVFVRGIDLSGFTGVSATTSDSVLTMKVSGQKLLIGKSGNSGLCTNVAGFAEGCELQIYDISNAAHPLYERGFDNSGSEADGSALTGISSILVVGSLVFTGSTGSSSACTDTSGNAIGCELKVFSLGATATGDLVGSNAFNDLRIIGYAEILDNASTTNLLVSTTSKLISPAALSIARDFTIPRFSPEAFNANNGTVFLTGDEQTISGPINFYNLRKIASGEETVIFNNNSNSDDRRVKILGSLELIGASESELLTLRGESTTTTWYLEPKGTVNVKNLDVQRSFNSGQYIISCLEGCIDSGNNTNWSFTGGTLKGTIFSDFGLNKLETEGLKVTAWIEGDLYSVEIVDDSGEYEINGFPAPLRASKTVVIFIDDNEESSAVLILKPNATSTLEDLDLYQNFLVLKSTQGTTTPIFTSDLSGFTKEDEEKLNFRVEKGEFILDEGQALYVASSTVFTVQGDMTVGGDLKVGDSGILNLTSTSTLTMRSSDVVEIAGVDKFGRLVFAGGGEYFLNENATATDLVIKDAVVNLPEKLATAGFKNQGEFSHENGEVTIFNQYEEKVLAYLRGIDVDGSIGGTGNLTINSLVIKDKYLYVAKSGLSTVCDTVVYNIYIGCEFLVFDISNINNIQLVYGWDVSGKIIGGGLNVSVSSLLIEGDYLIAGLAGSTGVCSNLAGSAHGCEIQIYSLASEPKKPVYLSGLDSSGSMGGSSSVGVTSLAIKGNYLYVGKNGSSSVCSSVAGSAHGCEVMVFDISDITNLDYVMGIDAASATLLGGNGNQSVYDLVIKDNSLYIGKLGNSTACSPVEGSALGCEVLVFDISNPLNPIYVAGRDSSGSSNGVSGGTVYSFALKDNYLFTGKSGGTSPCLSSSAGTFNQCELLVFDISSSTNPVVVSAADASGLMANALASGYFFKVVVSGDYLYASRNTNNNFCFATIGLNNQGCELHVYDISNPANPVYVAGQDVSGLVGDEGKVGLNTTALAVSQEGYVFLGKTGNATACSQDAGSAIGCELMVFSPVSGMVSGSFLSSNGFNQLQTKDTVSLVDELVTADFSILSGTTTLPRNITITGDFSNSGKIKINNDSTVFLNGDNEQVVSGGFMEDNALPNVSIGGESAVTFASDVQISNLQVGPLATLKTPEKIYLEGRFYNSGNIENQDGELILGNGFSYVKGVDVTGATDGSGSLIVFDLAQKDNYLFVGKGGNSTTCSQVAGSAIGCELMVYDISNPANPVYVAGRDSSGSATGTSGYEIRKLYVSGDYLFIGKSTTATGNCVQISGQANWCEVIIFDISDPTNPQFIAGIDASGALSGEGISQIVFGFLVKDDYLFVTKQGNSTACSQTVGEAIGCELQVYDISNIASPVYVAGVDADGSSLGVASRAAFDMELVGNQLYVVLDNSGSTCSQTAGSANGCELHVYDISNPLNPTFVAGRDSSGSSNGAGNVSMFDMDIKGNYLYVGKIASGSDCSDVANLAHGCEIMIFDVSSSTNPVFVAGRDVDGAQGVEVVNVRSVLVVGDTLFVGKETTTNQCLPVAGFGTGCKIMVFDISSSTNPIYKYGIDKSMSSLETTNEGVRKVIYKDGYLIAGGTASSVPCSQVAGGAQGCEITSIFVGSVLDGDFTLDNALGGVTVANRGLFKTETHIDKNLVINNDGKLYSPVDEVVIGGNYVNDGELKAPYTTFTFTGEEKTISGNLTGLNALNQLKVSGTTKINNNASTTDLSITTGGKLTAGEVLTVVGDFENRGSFDAMEQGTVVLDGEDQTILGTTTFYHLVKTPATTATTTFEAGSTFTVLGDLSFMGAGVEEKQILQSTVPNEQWFIDPQGIVSVNNLAVSDSNNLNVSTIFCFFNCLDSGNNTNWQFEPSPATLSSNSDHHFYVGQATTTLDTFFLRTETGQSISASDSVRLIIPTSTTDFRFDASVDTLTFSGSASEKVSNSVTYEEAGKVLVISVLDDFVGGDILQIEGIKVGSFASISPLVGHFGLYIGNDFAGLPEIFDDKEITITGLLEAKNHTLGQTENKFSLLNKINQTLFTFKLEALVEAVEVQDLVIGLSGIQGLGQENFSNWRLYQDIDSDGELSDGDVLVDENGILNINEQLGAITFNTNFTVATTALDYIVIADTFSISRNSTVVFDLLASGFSVLGETSALRPVLHDNISKIQHAFYGFSGGGGVSARIGIAPPSGNGVEEGGDEGGGVEIGGEDNGNRLVYSPNFFLPTAVATPTMWNFPERALQSDSDFAFTMVDGDMQGYRNFGFNIPENNLIQGILVQLNARGDVPFETNNSIEVQLSWDGGESWTVTKATPRLELGGYAVYEVGGASDKWGRAWNVGDFSAENFRLRIVAVREFGSGSIMLDALQVRVFHQPPASGGQGAGGAL